MTKEEYQTLPEIEQLDDLITESREKVKTMTEAIIALVPEQVSLEIEEIRKAAEAKVAMLLAPYTQAIADATEIMTKYLESVDKERSLLKKAIDIKVLANGKTMVGKSTMVVYSKGATTWESEKLLGYAAAHPEIKEFAKVGKPSVSYREYKPAQKES